VTSSHYYYYCFWRKDIKEIVYRNPWKRGIGLMRNKHTPLMILGRLAFCSDSYMLMLKGITGNNPLELVEEHFSPYRFLSV
jgi:hypothetical protein